MDKVKDYIFQGDDDPITDTIVYFLFSYDKRVGVRQSAPMLFHLQSGEFGAYRLRDKDAEKLRERNIERDMVESFNDYNQQGSLSP
jgi:hypothetical protein